MCDGAKDCLKHSLNLVTIMNMYLSLKTGSKSKRNMLGVLDWAPPLSNRGKSGDIVISSAGWSMVILTPGLRVYSPHGPFT